MTDPLVAVYGHPQGTRPVRSTEAARSSGRVRAHGSPPSVDSSGQADGQVAEGQRPDGDWVVALSSDPRLTRARLS